MSGGRGSFASRSQHAMWSAAIAIAAAGWAILLPPAMALDITGYSATVNDRFTAGFPTAPVLNTDGSFVGLPYDWSGVGWSTTIYAASSYKGFAMLSPVHFLTAQHYEHPALLTAGVRIRTNAGTVVSQTNSGPVDNLGYGLEVTNLSITAKDLAIGTLTAPIAAPSAFARYAILDLYTDSTSTAYSVYDGLPVLAYGHGASTDDSPRVAATTVDSAFFANADPTQTVIRTLRAGAGSVQLVEGDSGSPLLHGWTNPDGGDELTVLGLNTAIDSTYNYMSFLAVPGAMANANAVLNADGFALRVTGNPLATWKGSVSGDIGNGANYLGTPFLDVYFTFDADVAVTRNINVNLDILPRGLFFLSTASGSDGFTFSGATPLTIGRGGIVNYDNSRQMFTAPIALGASQYWDVGPGGVTAGDIDTAGFLLEVAGSGTAIISGDISGTGGAALSGTRLELDGTSSYTGATWVHSGTLVVNGSIATSSGVTVAAGGALAGSGSVPGITGTGSVDPGNSPGILTSPSVDPTGGLDFNFEFTQLESPTWSNSSASGNDVLRLTDASTPFTAALTSSNVINVYLDVDSIGLGDTFRGGFFTDRDMDFLASFENATLNYFLEDAGGSVSYAGMNYDLYAGPFTFDWSTVMETADFMSGSEAGYVSQFTAVPEPSTWVLIVMGSGAGFTVLRRRRAGA